MKQARTIIGGVIGDCDYSIATLKDIRAALVDYGNPHHNISWGVVSMMVILTSHLLRSCEEVFVESAKSGDGDVKRDLLAIKDLFSNFIDRMFDNE